MIQLRNSEAGDSESGDEEESNCSSDPSSLGEIDAGLVADRVENFEESIASAPPAAHEEGRPIVRRLLTKKKYEW